MSARTKFASLISVGFLTFALPLSAQLITYQTQTDYSGSVSTFGTSGSSKTRGQIFTDVSAVKSMTYNFFAGSGFGNLASTTSLSAVFGEWNTGTNSFVSGTEVSFGMIVIPASGSAGWSSTLALTGDAFANYSHTFNLAGLSSSLVHSTYGYLTDSAKSYALMLTNVTGSFTNLGLGLSNDDLFGYGYARGQSDYDYVFSQIVVAPGSQTLVPIPETGTVVSLAALVLVAGLAVLRVRQRRLQAPVAVSAA